MRVANARISVDGVAPLGSVEGFDGCDRDQVLHGVGEVPVECDQRVGVELGQCDVLGVEGVGPPEQDGGLPRRHHAFAAPATRQARTDRGRGTATAENTAR
jgi:hypothetical protein